MSKNRIPTEEEFARASAAMRERDRGLDEVRTRVMKRYSLAGLHELHLQFSPTSETFVAILFFKTEWLAQSALASGLSSSMGNEIAVELERVGRGPKDTMKVSLEVDSDENVRKKFNGNYDKRLR